MNQAVEKCEVTTVTNNTYVFITVLYEDFDARNGYLAQV